MNDEKKGVCHNCDKRQLGCHSTCEEYIDWVAMHKAEKEYIWNQKQKEVEKIQYLKQVLGKEKKKYGRRKR